MTDIYQKMLLVQYIPAIEGIGGVQDLIKSFAYRGDLYMEKAREFGIRCIQVLQDIDRIRNRTCLYTNKQNVAIAWYSDKLLNYRIIFQSEFCPTCGDFSRFCQCRRIYTG